MKKATKRDWKLKSRILTWMLIISMVVTALPVQQATAAERSGFPVQQVAAAEPSGFPVQQVAAAEPSGFQDVRPTDWFYNAAVYVQKNGIFSGTGAGLFSPEGTMTRAMYVTALGRMAGVDVSKYSASTFADVQAGIWYAPYVAWAVQKGITFGTGGRNFSPDATVTREQMSTMTLRYFEIYQIPYQTSNLVTTEPGDLADVSPWAADSIVKLWQAGLFNGDSNGNFNPHGQASRAEAAVLFMRSNAVVEAWANQNQPTVEPTPTPTSGPGGAGGGGGSGSGGSGGNNGGGNEGGTGIEYTLTFESNGGTAVAAQTVRQGEALSKLPAPAKVGYIFQGWFRDSELSLIFAEGSTVTANTKLYAKYIDSVSNVVQRTPSYSVLDVAPGFTIAINDASGSLTASEVQAGLAFEDTSNSDFEGIEVTESNGLFTVASAAEDKQFTEGHTYQLTLTDDNLTFEGQDATTSIYVFSVAKQEVMNIPLNPNMIYLPFAEVSDMMMDGAEIGSPAIPVITTTVGGSETGLAAANASSGTFTYTGSAAIQVGAAVAIYEGVRPDLRTVDATDDGDVAYVQITAINGNTYTYDHADAKQVLFKPDVLPVSIEADTDGERDNGSITIEHIAMNYSDSQYAPLGLSELTTVDVGDFIAFYEGEFGGQESRVIGYGRITSITPVAEMDVITYSDVKLEDMKNVFNVYQQQAIDGDQLLSNEEIAMLEDQIEQQAIASGFVDEAVNYLSTLAMETDAFKSQMEVSMLSASKASSKVSVENLTVVASLGTNVKNIAGQTSGVSASLQVGADIVIRIHEESDLVIHMTGTFLQEISLNLSVDGGTEWGEVCVWFLCIPYPKDYRITSNLDAYTYTGINVTAKIATVEHDKLQDVLDDWDKAATGGMLGKVRDIATEVQALIDGMQDAETDMAALKEQYQEMMENETEWVRLIKVKLFEKKKHLLKGLIEVKFTAEFVVSANVNLTIGADFNYTTAKRYSGTLRVLSFTGTSSTVSLPGDGNYQFTFYVMGSLGLRAGVLLELQAGFGSVDLNSIGISVEPGAYVNLWGYFYYQLKQLNGVKTTRSMGALFVEIGIYLESAVGAQLGDGLLEASVPIYENTWPLYTVGEQKHVDDFAYPEDKPLTLNLAGSVSSIAVPEKLLTMSRFDLKTGVTDTQTYDRSKFDIQVDNSNFRYNSLTGKIEVLQKVFEVSEGNMVITWKGAPLSFASEPLKRTISLNWLARVGDYIFQLDLQNGEATQIVAAPYNAAISVNDPVKQGYTFDGWYWTASGGSKVTIPSRMPSQDWMLYAHWIPNTDTPYTVQHYLIDPNTKTSTTSPAVTETSIGTTGTEIRISSDRFKNQGYATGTVSGVSIRGDGSTVVRVDYYPMNRTMTFVGGYAGAPASSLTEAVGKNIAARIPVPTRPGYTFAGWSPDIPGAMPALDTSYTAQWTAKEDTSYQVVYLLQNIGSDTYTVADTESYRGTTDTVASLTNPTKTFEGFTFNNTVPGTVLAAPIAGRGTTVLKVYYKRDNYAMTINYNGSGEATKIVNVPFGATTELYLGTPTGQGHGFTGWSPANLTTMPAQAVTFTAQWSLNNHTVSFNSNGGSTVDNQTVGYGNQVSQPAEPTKDDLVFAGWYSDSALTNTYDFATQVTAEITLYAKWLRSYTVSFESNGGSAVADQKVNEGTKATALSTPTLEEYVFGGWYSDSGLTSLYDFEVETVSANITLYAKWTIAPKTYYTVSFNSNGGTTVEEMTVVEGAVAMGPSAPTLTGHTFEGWYTDSALTSRFNFSTTPITDNLTLYAKWTMITFTLSFNSNGGTTVSSQTINYDGTATQPTAPTRSGYTFKGWYSDATLNTAYSFTTKVQSAFTLYAKWTAVYTVSFNSNGGSTVTNQNVEHGDKAVEPTAPTMDGYTFVGWYNDSALTEAYSFTDGLVITNLTLYAKWSFDSFTVTFDSNNGPAVQSQEVVPGGTAVAPATPKWVGYRFDGWYSNEGLSSAYDFSTVVNEAITLYAKWTMTSWVPLGDTIETVVDYHSKVVVDNQGTQYVAFYNSSNTVFVKKYVEATDEWQDVGDPTELAKTWGSVQISLAIDNENTLYVAYADDTMNNILKKYTDGHWVNVVDLTDNELTNNVKMAFDEDNTPYFAYINGNVSNYSSVVIKKLVDGSLVSIESGLLSNTPGDLRLEIDENNTLYLFYTKRVSLVTQAVLVKYEGSSHTKTVLSQPPSPSNVYRASFALSPMGVPYMTYVNSNNKVYVSRFEIENGTWQPVGDATAGFSVKSDGFTQAGIAFDSEGIPYVAYIDATLGDSVTLMKFDNDAWSVVEYAGVSDRNKNTNKIDINIDSNDNIYVNFISNRKETVLKYDPDLH